MWRNYFFKKLKIKIAIRCWGQTDRSWRAVEQAAYSVAELRSWRQWESNRMDELTRAVCRRACMQTADQRDALVNILIVISFIFYQKITKKNWIERYVKRYWYAKIRAKIGTLLACIIGHSSRVSKKTSNRL